MDKKRFSRPAIHSARVPSISLPIPPPPTSMTNSGVYHYASTRNTTWSLSPFPVEPVPNIKNRSTDQTAPSTITNLLDNRPYSRHGLSEDLQTNIATWSSKDNVAHGSLNSPPRDYQIKSVVVHQNSVGLAVPLAATSHRDVQDGSSTQLLTSTRRSISLHDHPIHEKQSNVRPSAWVALLDAVAFELKTQTDNHSFKPIVPRKPDHKSTMPGNFAKEYRSNRRRILREKERRRKEGLTVSSDGVQDRTEEEIKELEKLQRSKNEIRRLKNRESVQKCRGRQKERLDHLHEERDRLAIENRILKTSKRAVENSGLLKLLEQFENAQDKAQFLKDLMDGNNALAFVELVEVEEEKSFIEHEDEVIEEGLVRKTDTEPSCN